MRAVLGVAATAFVFVMLFGSAAASAGDLVDPRGVWQHKNDVLQFTGKSVKRGRYVVEDDYMGMRVSSRGKWLQPEAGIIVWKLTDINIGGRPGDSAMLPKAGDFMFGIFDRVSDGKLKLFYVMKGYAKKDKANYPERSDLDDAPEYTKKK